MKRKTIAIFGTLTALSISLLWLFRPSVIAGKEHRSAPPVSSPSPTPRTSSASAANQSPEEQRKVIAEGVEVILSTPIMFYGKVIDQHGHPIADAEVGYSALDRFMKMGLSYKGRSGDETGLFEDKWYQRSSIKCKREKEGILFHRWTIKCRVCLRDTTRRLLSGATLPKQTILHCLSYTKQERPSH